MRTQDVLIIGAGAAGSTAAFHLAKSGHSVTLLDKSHKKLIKPCGGGMSAAVQKLFPFDLQPIVEEVINQVNFSWCLEDEVCALLPGQAPFWIVKRERLDEFITTQAINQGAEFVNAFEVKSIKKIGSYWQLTSQSGEQLQSKVVIIANGSRSTFPSEFNLGPKTIHHASTISVRLEGRGNLQRGSSRFEFGLVQHGFAWAFPLTDGVNVGIGSFIGKRALNSVAVLDKLLPSLGFCPDEGERTEALLRVWNGHSKLNGEGILAVGDAASLCDPFLAEGLRPALLSGYEAARSIDNWLIGEARDLDSYSIAMRNNWGKSMAWGRRISQVFYRFPKVGYQLGIKRPTAPKRIAQILSGEMGYEDIASRVIKRLLFQGS